MPNLSATLRIACLSIGAAGLFACANDASQTPDSLDQLVIQDPNFDFATSRSAQVRLERTSEALEAPVEITDAEGRRLMTGAFKQSASIDLKIPVGTQALTIRTTQGDQAVEQTVTLDSRGQAAGQF